MTEEVVGHEIQGESKEGASLSPIVHEEKVSEKAREKGWRPLEEWEGSPEDWVDAREFVGRQKLYDRISDLKGAVVKQRQEFQNEMKLVANGLSKIREAEYKRAKTQLEAQRDIALEEDDARTAVKVSKDIEDLERERQQEAQAAAARPQSGPTPEFVDWQKENPWFTADKEMQSDAISIGVGHASGNPNKSQVEVLEYVTTKIKRMYPERFESKEKRQVTNPVEGGAQPSVKQAAVNGRKGKLSMADLPDEHQVVAKTLIRSGVFKAQATKNKRSEVDEYLAQYQENQ